MPSAACAFCRERKLRCDRKLPHCSSCVRLRRPCPGYKQVLSWPRPNDKKRSLLGPEPYAASRRVHPDLVDASLWVNVDFRDINAHHYLSKRHLIREQRSRLIDSPLSFTPELSWIPTRLDAAHQNLLQYFQLVGSTVITCDVADQNILKIITRLAFLDDSASSQAVLYAALAVSSLLRHGPDVETIGLQGAALRALEKSAKAGINGSKVVQHMAAGMLLCSFEVQGSFRTSGLWSLYVSGGKQLIRTLEVDKYIISNELVGTTNWVYHYDISAQFSLRHWRRKEMKMTDDPQPPKQVTVRDNTTAMAAIVKKISGGAGGWMSSRIFLWPLADIFQNIIDSSHPQYHSVLYRKELESLEYELESIFDGKYVSEADRPDLTSVETKRQRETATLEIYRLAALIYLERASRNFSGTSPKLDSWASAGFKLLKMLEVCKHGIPLFIIACEARTDEQRIIILDCFNKSQRSRASVGMNIVKDMIQSAWNLEDLETEREVDYMTKLDVIVSGCETMPCFA